MQIDYSNDGHGLPSDFPSDPVFHLDYLFWGFGGLILLVVLAAVFFLFYKIGEQQVLNESYDAISRRVEAVRKMLSDAARAPQDQIEDRLVLCVEEIKQKQFHRTLALSEKFGKMQEALNTAIDGTEKKDYKPDASLPAAANMAGSTMISIAVNNSVVGAGPYAMAPAAAPLPDKVAMSEDEKREAVWKAVQRIFDYWKHRNSVIASLRAVQLQISQSPAWQEPRIDERLLAATLFRREE